MVFFVFFVFFVSLYVFSNFFLLFSLFFLTSFIFQTFYFFFLSFVFLTFSLCLCDVLCLFLFVSVCLYVFSQSQFSFSCSAKNVKSTFCTVSRRFKFGVVYQFPRKTTTDEQLPRSACCVRVFGYHISQLCRGMTPTYHRAALNGTLFERKRFQARFLIFPARTRGRRTSQGVVDTTTVHYQSSRHLSRFRLPVSQIQLYE